jgi:predicted Zn-dependent protease
MKRLFLFITLLLCFHVAVLAQKKAINQARTFIKSGKNLDKAEKLMTDLLQDSTYRYNEKVWLTLADVLKKQYEQGNEKLYLKQKYDTVSLFTTAKKMFYALQVLDTIDATPDKKGKVNIRYRDKNAEYLNTFRPNLYNAGSFFLRKNNYRKAYEYYDFYLDCARQPLFSKLNYQERDTMMPQAAFWAMYAGYRLRDAEKVLKYRQLAERDTARLDNVIQYLAETFIMQADTAEYVEQLRRGFDHNPQHPFFFPHLIDYYNSVGWRDSANVIIDNALASDSINQLFLFAKSTALLNAGDYDQCLRYTQKLMEQNDSLPEAYCNMGLAYYNQAINLEQTMARSKKKRKAVNALYEKSRPYMEKYREMQPDQQSKWLAPLYAIYLNLNMGKEFEEIDKLVTK